MARFDVEPNSEFCIVDADASSCARRLAAALPASSSICAGLPTSCTRAAEMTADVRAALQDLSETVVSRCATVSEGCFFARYCGLECRDADADRHVGSCLRVVHESIRGATECRAMEIVMGYAQREA